MRGTQPTRITVEVLEGDPALQAALIKPLAELIGWADGFWAGLLDEHGASSAFELLANPAILSLPGVDVPGTTAGLIDASFVEAGLWPPSGHAAEFAPEALVRLRAAASDWRNAAEADALRPLTGLNPEETAWFV